MRRTERPEHAEGQNGEYRGNTRAIVVGAGPVGCATALALHKQGYRVEIYEARDDPRTLSRDSDSLRSINLALSSRGIETLKSLGGDLAARVSSSFVPMSARMVHNIAGKESSVPYGVYGESINSVGRITLTLRLLDEVKAAGIKVHFQHKFVSAATPAQGPLELKFEVGDSKQQRVRADFVVGCDGTFSKVRLELQRHVNFDYSQEFIDDCYIEMPIPRAKNGGYAFRKNFLHIWPRQQYMFIGLPNEDGTFTGTLFAPRALVQSLDTVDKFTSWFKSNFCDAYDAIGPDLVASYFSKPRGSLVSSKCSPYNWEDKILILGDAAHSMVPFYGQGLNAGLEDVRVLAGLLKQTSSRARAFSQYSAQRRKDLAAICDLSMRNYVEMRDSVATRSFAVRKRVDNFLAKALGDRWVPLYTMVSFRPDIRYSDAVERDAKQSRILSKITGVVELVLGLAFVAVVYYVLKTRNLLESRTLREFTRANYAQIESFTHDKIAPHVHAVIDPVRGQVRRFAPAVGPFAQATKNLVRDDIWGAFATFFATVGDRVHAHKLADEVMAKLASWYSKTPAITTLTQAINNWLHNDVWPVSKTYFSAVSTHAHALAKEVTTKLAIWYSRVFALA